MQDNDIGHVNLDMDDNLPPGHRKIHEPRRGKGRLVLIIAIIVIVLGLGGAGAYLLIDHLVRKDMEAKPMATQQEEPQEKTAEDSPATTNSLQQASGPQTFKSTKLNTEITQPKGWTLKEDAETGGLTLASPKITYARKDGTSHEGPFVLKLQKGGKDTELQAIRAATVLQASETIGYTAPTDQQRHYTNISIAGKGDAASFFLISGSSQFKPGESLGNYLINGDTYVIFGGYGGTGTDTFASFDPLTKEKFVTYDAYTQAIEIVKSLKIF